MNDVKMGTAQLTEIKPRGWREDADVAVYHCDPPMPWTDWTGDEDVLCYADLVIVSAVPFVGTDGPETYIFAARKADSGGIEIASWTELPGSFRGGMDHAEALRGAGYEVVR